MADSGKLVITGHTWQSVKERYNVMVCVLCKEPLTGIEAESGHYHHDPNYHEQRIPLWDACIRAAKGDDARLLRVHTEMANKEPLLARAYAGDR